MCRCSADFPAAAIDAVVALAGADVETSLQSVEVRHLGGALARSVPGGGAQPTIDGVYAIFAVGITPTPELGAAVRTEARAIRDALGPWHADHDYYNLAETRSEANRVLSRDSYRRLRAIKTTYDPDEAIISAHPVQPAGIRR